MLFFHARASNVFFFIPASWHLQLTVAKKRRRKSARMKMGEREEIQNSINEKLLFRLNCNFAKWLRLKRRKGGEYLQKEMNVSAFFILLLAQQKSIRCDIKMLLDFSNSIFSKKSVCSLIFFNKKSSWFIEIYCGWASFKFNFVSIYLLKQIFRNFIFASIKKLKLDANKKFF